MKGALARARHAVRRRLHGEAGGLAKDTVYVAVWQGATTAADFAQIPLLTYFLGLEAYGQFALVIAAVTFVGQFLNPRVGIAAVTHGSKAWERDPREAAGVFQLTCLIDLATGVLAFLVLLAIAPFAGADLVGDHGTAALILYAVYLLPSSFDRSALSVLRLLDRFRFIAKVTVAGELFRLALILVAVVVFDSLVLAVAALVIGKAVISLCELVGAVRWFRASTGTSLTEPALRAVDREERRAVLHTIFHTNLFSYQRLVQNQVPTLLLGAIAGATETAIYKVGIAASAAIGAAVDPARAALLARLSRLWAAGRRAEVRVLVTKASMVSTPVVLGLFALIALLHGPILDLLSGGNPVEGAGVVLLLGMLGQVTYASAFWRTAVLFAAHRSRVVGIVASIGAVLMLVVLVPAVVAFGAVGAAAGVLVGRVFTDGVLTVIAVRLLRDDAGDPEPVAGRSPSIAAQGG